MAWIERIVDGPEPVEELHRIQPTTGGDLERPREDDLSQLPAADTFDGGRDGARVHVR